MKIYKSLLICLAGVVMFGCYNDFDMPDPYKRYSDVDEFAEQTGLQKVTIKEVKDMFETVYGSISGTGENDDWNDTKTLKFGQLTQSEKRNGIIKSWAEASGYFIAGKVLSDDTQGNIYKSLFIYDGTAAIEIKLTNGNYLKYPQGNWVYIKLDGLYLGNYRMMLSIGEGPSDSYNAVGEHKFYANSNIEDLQEINKHVFLGPVDVLVDGVDIKVVNKDNYTQLGKADLGRLIRFEGITCHYAGVKNQNGVTNPMLISGSYDSFYPSWIDTNVRPVVNKPWYKWAFSIDGISLYGSVCFTYRRDELLSTTTKHYLSEPGIYVVRSSGYSRFAGRGVPRDGAVANITAIYSIYSKQSTFTGGSNDYANYQLSVNNFEDMEFVDGEAALLTDGTKDTNHDGKVDSEDSNEVLALTPNGYDPETGVYDPSNDSYYVPSKETSDRQD